MKLQHSSLWKSACVLLAIYFCGAANAANDFSLTESRSLNLPLTDVRAVVVRCHCTNFSVKRVQGKKGIDLRIVGTFSSLGYHGPQAKPERVPPELLTFVERRTEGTLTLDSSEYTHIHLARIIDSLEIVAPADLELRVESLSYQLLEGRRAKLHK